MNDKQARDNITYCFFDTNILLHFQMFDEVDWPTVLGAYAVCLMVAPVVLRELSDHKDDSRNERRQKRARDVLPKLEKVLPDEPGQYGYVRDGVTIRDVSLEPRIAWAKRGLDPQIHDDRLLATILTFKQQYPSADVCLITDDVPLRRKASHHGIRVVKPDSKLVRVPFAATPLETENRKLKQELEEIKQRAPKLEFGLWENGALVKKADRPLAGLQEGAPTDEQLNAEIMSLRGKQQAIVAQASADIPQNEIEKYKSEHSAYLKELWLARRMERSIKYGPRCTLSFSLVNSGGATATDVYLEIAFPRDSLVFDARDADIYGSVEIPTEPVAKWTTRPHPLGLYMPNLGALTLPMNTILPPHGRRGPLYRNEGDQSTIWFEDPKLLQDSRWIIPTIIAYLPPDTKQGFTIKYCLRADEFPKVVSGNLHVVWKDE